MYTRRSFGLAIVIVLFAACLLVVGGCTGQAELSVEDESREFQEPGVGAGDLEPEGPALEPDWSQPAPDLVDMKRSEPDDVPYTPETTASPDFEPAPVRIQPAPLHMEIEPAPPSLSATEPRSISAVPGEQGDYASDTSISPKPRMAKPSILPDRREPESSRLRPMAPGARQPVGVPQPVAVQPQPMVVEPSPLETAAREPRAMELRAEVPEREPAAARSEVDIAATAPDENPRAAVATSPESTSGVADLDSGQSDYEVVKVFYGTDRNAIEVLEPAARGYIGWFYLTALCAGATAVLMVVAYRFTRRLPILVLTGAGVVLTVLLSGVTTLTRLQAEAPGPRPDRNYGNERGELEMGYCEVSIPKHHEAGEVERPSVFRFEFEEDPRRHVVLLGVEEQPADKFFADLRARVDASGKKEAFVFVHGFNFTFEEAAHRTAQLAYDLKFDGAPIFFSWPSQGGVLQYSIDETNVVWAVPHLKEFVTQVARRSGADAVHLIAHSMGNRALTAALQSLSYEMKDEPPLFREVVLTAPDIDADVFRRDIAPAIVNTAHRVTLYASSNDEALKLSKQIHGYRRAGESGDQLLVIPGMDTIDVSTVDTSLLGHDYYGDNTTVIADMLDLINESKPARLRRWLKPMQLGGLMYWVFQGGQTVLGAAPPSESSTRR